MGNAENTSNEPNPGDITPLLAPLQALQNLISEFGDQGVIIGGIASSLLGTPRYTADVDAVLLLSSERLPELLQAATRQGIRPRIQDAEAFARKNRVLLLRHSASGVDIDLALGFLPFESEMVARSQLITIGAVNLRLPTVEDMIILKAVAHRPKDLEDIQAMAANHPTIDRTRIRIWVEQFGQALDMPELWEMIAGLL